MIREKFKDIAVNRPARFFEYVGNFRETDNSLDTMNTLVSSYKVLLEELSRGMIPRGDYTESDVRNFLISCVENQRKDLENFNDGSFSVAPDHPMPSDARMLLNFFPTFIIATIMIIADRNFPWVTREIPGFYDSLKLALTFAGYRRLDGHGYDSQEEKKESVNIFRKGRVRQWLEARPDFHPKFLEILQEAEYSVVHDPPRGWL